MRCWGRLNFLAASPEERKAYYMEEWDKRGIPDFILATIKEREFGFDHNGDGPRDRYNTFNSGEQLETFLRKKHPFAAYTSVSLYEVPEKRGGWLNAELVFDIDAKDLPVKSCGCAAGKVCATCLMDAKDFLVMTADVLRGDLGLKEVRYVYSGRGYHIRVLDEEIMGEDSVVRGEILDYVGGSVLPSGVQWRLKRGYPRVFKERALKFMQSLSKEKIAEMPNISAPKALQVKKKARLIANELEDGDLTTLKKILKKKGMESFLENLRLYNSSVLDGKVTVDVKRILRLPSSLHSAVSMKCMEVKNIERFDPLRDAVPKFVGGRP
jgi:DNA primase small subunit